MNRFSGPWTRSSILVGVHVGVMVVAFVLALLVRFEGQVSNHWWASLWRFVPGVVSFAVLVYASFGLYAKRRPGLAVSAGLATIAAAVALATSFRLVPLSVAALGALVSAVGFDAIRLALITRTARP